MGVLERDYEEYKAKLTKHASMVEAGEGTHCFASIFDSKFCSKFHEISNFSHASGAISQKVVKNAEEQSKVSPGSAALRITFSQTATHISGLGRPGSPQSK